MKKFIYLLAIMPLLSGCIKVGVAGCWFYVVKFKADYADNAFAVNSYMSPPTDLIDYRIIIMNQAPVQLTGGYYVYGEMYGNAVALSIRREESFGSYSSDSIKSLIIDDDPIEELWLRDEQGRNRRFDIDCYGSGCCPYDTAALNGVIKAGKLKRYFDRIK